MLHIAMPDPGGFGTGRVGGDRLTRMPEQVIQTMTGQGRLYNQQGAGQGKQYASMGLHLSADYTIARRNP